LSDKSAEGDVEIVAPFAKESAAQGLSFWIGEGNSVACGGMPNVSDVFGSALWAVDYLFNAAAVGVQGMNFHGNSNNLFVLFIQKNKTKR